MKTRGERVTRHPRSCRTPSKSLGASGGSEEARISDAPNSGSKRTSSARHTGSSAASRVGSSASRAARIASIHGPKARICSPSWQRPTRTRIDLARPSAPAAWASAASVATRRVLPAPVSPTRKAVCPDPLDIAASQARRWAISSSRPTRATSSDR